MEKLMLRISNVSKMYKLGQIGGTTLRDELQRLNARMHGREDPTKRIGARDYNKGETFMALDGVSFDVKKGERVGIIGHNGAGKSTLLKLISRVTAPTGGSIGLNGRVASMLEVGTGFHGELTGRENIYMNGAILGMTKKEIDAKMEDIIEFSECRQFIDTPVKRYSSGMYVKLAFSVAAHLDSEIMIMDEVLAVGDANYQKKCLDKMRFVSEKEERTVLYVSHNMGTIRTLCNRCIVLDKGKIKFDGDVEAAIGLYYNNVSSLKQINEYANVKRDSGVNHKIEFHSLELISQSNQILFGGKLSFKVSFLSLIATEKLILRFNFYPQNREVFATSLTEFIRVEENTEYEKIITIDTSLFSPDKYRVRMVAFEPNMLGGQVRYDCIDEAFYFEIYNSEEDFSMQWDNSWWGNYIMPRAKTENVLMEDRNEAL